MERSITMSKVFGAPGEPYVAAHSKTDIHLLRLGKIPRPTALLANPVLTTTVPHRLPTPLLPTPILHTSRTTPEVVVHGPAARFVPDGPVIHLPITTMTHIPDGASFYGRGMEASPGEDLMAYFHRRAAERLSAPPN